MGGERERERERGGRRYKGPNKMGGTKHEESQEDAGDVAEPDGEVGGAPEGPAEGKGQSALVEGHPHLLPALDRLSLSPSHPP